MLSELPPYRSLIAQVPVVNPDIECGDDFPTPSPTRAVTTPRPSFHPTRPPTPLPTLDPTSPSPVPSPSPSFSPTVGARGYRRGCLCVSPALHVLLAGWCPGVEAHLSEKHCFADLEDPNVCALVASCAPLTNSVHCDEYAASAASVDGDAGERGPTACPHASPTLDLKSVSAPSLLPAAAPAKVSGGRGRLGRGLLGSSGDGNDNGPRGNGGGRSGGGGEAGSAGAPGYSMSNARARAEAAAAAAVAKHRSGAATAAFASVPLAISSNNSNPAAEVPAAPA